MHSNEQILISAILTILFIGIIISFLVWLKTLVEKTEYIKSEMEHTSGEERVFWEEKLKKIYLKSIPVIGKFIK